MTKYLPLLLFILCFESTIYAQQDTLITKKGKIYFGIIVNDDSKYIEFQLQNWTSTTKISHDKIGKLINSDGEVLIQNSFKPIKIVNSAKFNYSSMNIEEKAIYDAKKNATRWIAYPILGIPISGGLATATFFIFEDTFRAPDDVALAFGTTGGGFLGLIGFYHLFSELDEKNMGNTSTENIELYERTYIEEYKKKKLQNIFIGSALISLTTVAIIAIINPFGGMGNYDPCFDPRCD
jgi:hypothetical protein